MISIRPILPALRLCLAACAGIAFYAFLSGFIPEAHCRDGWESSSIGIQGACSHHGGVKRYGDWKFLAFLASCFASAIAWLLFGQRESSEVKNEIAETTSRPPDHPFSRKARRPSKKRRKQHYWRE
jgi:hypothetical protein